MNKENWPRSVLIITVRSADTHEGRAINETSYYIIILRNKAKELLQHVRERWSIENSWHWVRDTQLREDAHRYRECNGVQVLAALHTMALNLLRLNEFHSIADGLGTVCQSVALLLRLMRCHVQESLQTVSARDF
ncbi:MULTISPECIES: ISAs1 family transposase [unclassified Cyanobium]|uniref:ISAs1 family transposase n=1 Tax=unclassified Cyanobium TaxID=2627006 RepID=UPI0037BF9EBA|nr:ISAs1 family transposase [Cyanobium sp. Cruz-8H5]MCP9866799.1 ISAs1 family transposase [Cyanobium sp. Cruz-8D1]